MCIQDADGQAMHRLPQGFQRRGGLAGKQAGLSVMQGEAEEVPSVCALRESQSFQSVRF